MIDWKIKDGLRMEMQRPGGSQYSRIELNGLVDGHAEVMEIPSPTGKVMVYDGDARAKGKLINRIATGFVMTLGGYELMYGVVLLLDREHIEPSMMEDMKQMKLRP